jgi:predicted enzyme related to lactoylglutathione lyase
MTGNRSPVLLLLAVCAIVCVTTISQAGDTQSVVGETAAPTATGQPLPRPPIASQTVMFYYDDLAAAEEFYGTVLGLDKTQDFGWAKMFRVSAGAEVGIVKSGPGAYHAAQPKNAVMLSIVTTDVDAWYARLKAAKGVRFLAEISSGQSAPIRNFMIEDPGGYTVEFFQWL